ncbi:DUF7619 domain-containing protein [Flavobacterium wongokense]|uniref:DUF7619 domain-containing protein n=1 Tax=Flavobacterium wongokense TaxID=2910674 RepID=UPI001F1F32A0|nr:T9SS type A sorting domain-containing protein [Flavobacterium sp. WG47]MCF6133040.1 T9SS type A sorting domain-containing protein [Flavobacterium sp. WG47]
MKKPLLFLLFLTAFANAQIVNIPDANFKTLLLRPAEYQVAKDINGNYVAIDTNNDGEIQVSEALVIRSLEISQQQIANITGLEAFVELTRLSLGGTQITNLPLNSLANLNYIFLGGNQLLTTLDLSPLHNLVTAYCDYNSFTSVNVSGLTNLHTFTCNENELTSLNVTGLTNLVELRFTDNQLTNINLNGLTNLEILLCYQNHLSTLDLTGLTNLQYLHCDSNSLTSLDVSGNPNLVQFSCAANQLTSINVDNQTHLRTFACSDNLLTSLSFHNTPQLAYVGCQENQLTSLDVSTLTNLDNLYCNDNLLTSLDLNNNINLVFVNFMTNPLEIVMMKNGRFQQYPTGIETGTGPIDNEHTPLQIICADEFEINYWRSIFENNLISTTYCTFTPGGSYNTITGSLVFDAANDGCGAGDLSFPNTRVRINDGTISESNFTETDGTYNFYTQEGDFTITPTVENAAWFNFSPTTASIHFDDHNNNIETRNFCLTANGVHPDLEVLIVPSIPARPGFQAVYQVVYKNKGNQILSGDIAFTYDEDLTDYVSATVNPNSQGAGSLQWTFGNLRPFEERSFTITFNVNAPNATPPVSIGDVLHFAATINPIVGDETPGDNGAELNQIVVGSFDPNNKTCVEGTLVSTIKIGDYLHYTINFENTGTAAAENIVVNDVIDTAKFNLTTFQVMHSSHPVVTKINQNLSKVEFAFEGINLAAGGHGNVVFKVKTKSNLVAGNFVTNKADIYFDYNLPIVTNTATTSFQALGLNENEMDHTVTIYPNPAKDHININSQNTIKSIQLFDINGRILLTKISAGLEEVVPFSDYSKGIYFLKITTEAGMKTEKIVKE